MKRESELSKELGVPRNLLRSIRQDLGLGEKRGNAVCFNAGDEIELRKELFIRAGVALEAAPPPEPSPAKPESLVVVSVPKNPRLLICRTQGGHEVRVRCRSNHNFIRGMSLKATIPPKGESVWALTGRSPRFRGRW